MRSGPPGSSRAARPTWRACGWTRPPSWAEFREACRFFHVPSENMVWADRDGHIGWQAVGLAPRRRGWDGLLAGPGGRALRVGRVPAGAGPAHLADPPRGWFASANQDNLPAGLSVRGQLPVDRAVPVRADRGGARRRRGRLTLMDSMRLQQDELSLPARSLVPMLRGPEAGPARHGRCGHGNAAGLGLRDAQGRDPPRPSMRPGSGT